MNAPTLNEKTVEQLHKDLLAAWNQRDAKRFASCFDEDGNVVGFDGSQIDGRDRIETEMGAIFANHPTAAYVGKIREIRFLDPGTVLLRAVVGMVPPGKKTLDPSKNAVQSLVAIEEGGEWRISLFQNTPAQFHGRPEHAQALTEELSALL